MLTSVRAFNTYYTHTARNLPSWHRCTGPHGHSGQIVVRVTWPNNNLGGQDVELIAALGELERDLLGMDLPTVLGRDEPDDLEAYAHLVHDRLCAQFPALRDGLEVYAQDSAYAHSEVCLPRKPRRWPAAPAPLDTVPSS